MNAYQNLVNELMKIEPEEIMKELQEVKDLLTTLEGSKKELPAKKEANE